MHETTSAYGHWGFVLVNAAVFIVFAFSFFKPNTKRDWHSFGAFIAFLVALFAEMYGFPLTIYVLSGWFQTYSPGVDWFSHDSGHILETLLGWKANPQFGPFHVLSYALLIGGFMLISAAWKPLHSAQWEGRAAVGGTYAYVRHPKYVGFVLVLLGFLVQWPTLLTLAMFPFLIVMYVRLARSEERKSLVSFGEVYAAYMRQVPAFIPRWSALVGRVPATVSPRP